jgi:6-phosphogluconolactonase
MNSREIFRAGTADDVARESANRFISLANQAIKEQGRFAVALSGGSTPRRLYTLLAQAPYRQAVNWSRVHLFFADERYVPPEDPESTLLLVRETLLSGAPIPATNVHPMPTQGESAESDAALYSETLTRFFETPAAGFDLALLGMGPDGHTASLFPGQPEQQGLVAAIHDSPKPPPTRITLTRPLLNRSGAVLFLVTGKDKAEALKAVFESADDDPHALPAARIHANDGCSQWLVDRDAASRVPG